MPPKARITKDMIIDAAFNVMCRSGAEDINVRKIAAELNCSTQPVMYHFKTMEELRAEVFEKAVDHYMARMYEDSGQSVIELCRSYLTFAMREPNMFKFIFQSGRLKADRYESAFKSERIKSITAHIIEENGISERSADLVMSSLYTSLHGFASLYVNGFKEYNEEFAMSQLCFAFSAFVEHYRTTK